MGNQPNFCCDHNAQMKLFQSKVQTLSHKDYREFQKDLKGAARQRNNIFIKDDTSIIDQFQLKSQISQIGQKKIGSTTNLNLRQKNHHFDDLNTTQTNRTISLGFEKEWVQYKRKELQKDKQNQRKLIREQLMKQLQPKQSLRQRPATSMEREDRRGKTNKQFDFQFVVNYHR